MYHIAQCGQEKDVDCTLRKCALIDAVPSHTVDNAIIRNTAKVVVALTACEYHAEWYGEDSQDA